ncbi:MAG: hypothetical protein ACPGVB_06795 [Chitinophagales bacterium]
MLKIPIHTEIDVQLLLKGVETMEINDLENFARDLNAMIARKKIKNKDYQIAKLLRLHNETILDTTKRNRFFVLLDKLQAEAISDIEHKEYLALAEEEENLRLKRVKYLIKLSQLRNITLPVLMAELGLTPIGHA